MRLEERLHQVLDGAREMTWADDALCAETDPDAFFPPKGHPSAPAKRVCMACPVRVQCLEWAMAHELDFGVLGGMSARERKRLRRERSAAA